MISFRIYRAGFCVRIVHDKDGYFSFPLKLLKDDKLVALQDGYLISQRTALKDEVIYQKDEALTFVSNKELTSST